MFMNIGMNFRASWLAFSGEMISGSGVEVGDGEMVEVEDGELEAVVVGNGIAVGASAWQATRTINSSIHALVKRKNFILYPRDSIGLCLWKKRWNLPD
jgi:hypothetical protein